MVTFSPPGSAATATVTADFGKRVDYPLSKPKFAANNSYILPMAQFHRDIDLINELAPESLHIDGALGAAPFCGYTNEPASGALPADLCDGVSPPQRA